MRYLYYVDNYLYGDKLERFEEQERTRLIKSGFLAEDDALAVISRPGYITEIVTLAGE